MVNNIVSGPQVKAMDGSIYKSALGDQQASVEQQSAINAMAKSGGAIPVPANQPAYNEQAAGNQTSQAISNRLNLIGAAASANSEFDSKVGQKAGKRSKRRSSKRSKKRSAGKKRSRKSKRSKKYYRR